MPLAELVDDPRSLSLVVLVAMPQAAEAALAPGVDRHGIGQAHAVEAAASDLDDPLRAAQLVRYLDLCREWFYIFILFLVAAEAPARIVAPGIHLALVRQREHMSRAAGHADNGIAESALLIGSILRVEDYAGRLKDLRNVRVSVIFALFAGLIFLVTNGCQSLLRACLVLESSDGRRAAAEQEDLVVVLLVAECEVLHVAHRNGLRRECPRAVLV